MKGVRIDRGQKENRRQARPAPVLRVLRRSADRIERVGNALEHGVDVRAGGVECGDRDHGDETEDQTVLDEALSLVVPLLEKLLDLLNHFSFTSSRELSCSLTSYDGMQHPYQPDNRHQCSLSEALGEELRGK